MKTATYIPSGKTVRIIGPASIIGHWIVEEPDGYRFTTGRTALEPEPEREPERSAPLRLTQIIWQNLTGENLK